MYLVFTGESYRWQIRSSLCLWNVFRALMISLVYWFCASALGLVLFQICNYGYKVAVLIKYRGTHLSETAIERTHSVADRHCTASTVLSLQRRSLSLTLFISTLEISRYTWCQTASETWQQSRCSDDDVGLHALGCRVDILGTNCSDGDTCLALDRLQWKRARVRNS